MVPDVSREEVIARKPTGVSWTFWLVEVRLASYGDASTLELLLREKKEPEPRNLADDIPMTERGDRGDLFLVA